MPPPVVYLERSPAAAPAPARRRPSRRAAPRRRRRPAPAEPRSICPPRDRSPPLCSSAAASRSTIDASAVGQVGAQCVQVLLSAKRTWEADGVSLSIVNCARPDDRGSQAHRNRPDARDWRTAAMSMTILTVDDFAHHARHAQGRADGRGLSRHPGGRRPARARGSRAGDAAGHHHRHQHAEARRLRLHRKRPPRPALPRHSDSRPDHRELAREEEPARGAPAPPVGSSSRSNSAKLVDVVRRVAA